MTQAVHLDLCGYSFMSGSLCVCCWNQDVLAFGCIHVLKCLMFHIEMWEKKGMHSFLMERVFSCKRSCICWFLYHNSGDGREVFDCGIIGHLWNSFCCACVFVRRKDGAWRDWRFWLNFETQKLPLMCESDCFYMFIISTTNCLWDNRWKLDAQLQSFFLKYSFIFFVPFLE